MRCKKILCNISIILEYRYGSSNIFIILSEIYSGVNFVKNCILKSLSTIIIFRRSFEKFAINWKNFARDVVQGLSLRAE